MKKNHLSILMGMLIIMNMAFPPSLEAKSSPKKEKVRMSVQYVKIVNQQAYLEIHAKAKGKKGYHPVTNLALKIYQVFGDSTVFISEVKTDQHGATKFILQNLISLPTDTTGYFTYKVASAASDAYKASKKTVEFYDLELLAKINTKDSVNYVEAQAINPINHQPIKGIPLKVQIKRTLSYLEVGKDTYITDSTGSVFVPVDNDIPGLNGILTIRVAVIDSDDYGTVSFLFDAPIGVSIITTDTFDERTMWSPPSKTPLYLLIWPNLIIFGIWVTLFVLMFNLYQISKIK